MTRDIDKLKERIRQLSYSYNEEDHTTALTMCCNKIFSHLDKQELHKFLFALKEMDMICPYLYADFDKAFDSTRT